MIYGLKWPFLPLLQLVRSTLPSTANVINDALHSGVLSLEDDKPSARLLQSALDCAGYSARSGHFF